MAVFPAVFSPQAQVSRNLGEESWEGERPRGGGFYPHPSTNEPGERISPEKKGEKKNLWRAGPTSCASLQSCPLQACPRGPGGLLSADGLGWVYGPRKKGPTAAGSESEPVTHPTWGQRFRNTSQDAETRLKHLPAESIWNMSSEHEGVGRRGEEP